MRFIINSLGVFGLALYFVVCLLLAYFVGTVLIKIFEFVCNL